MSHNKLKNAFLMTTLALALSGAPAAQAQSRDTGVGALIAVQGNQALLAIKAELKQAIQSLKPAKSQLQAPPPAAVKVKQAAVSGSGTSGVAAARCAP